MIDCAPVSFVLLRKYNHYFEEFNDISVSQSFSETFTALLPFLRDTKHQQHQQQTSIMNPKYAVTRFHFNCITRLSKCLRLYLANNTFARFFLLANISKSIREVKTMFSVKDFYIIP